MAEGLLAHDTELEPAIRPRSALLALARLVTLVTGSIAAVLFFRFWLLLMDANTEAEFTRLVYALSAPLVVPFRDVFRALESGTGAVLEWTALLALSVYALLGVTAARMLTVLGRRRLVRKYLEESHARRTERTDVRREVT